MRRFPVLISVCLALAAGLGGCGARSGARSGTVSGPYVGGAGGGTVSSH